MVIWPVLEGDLKLRQECDMSDFEITLHGMTYYQKKNTLNNRLLLVPSQSVGIDISLGTHVEVYRHAQPPPKIFWLGGPVWQRSNNVNIVITVDIVQNLV
jgi:hypothetical protein